MGHAKKPKAVASTKRPRGRRQGKLGPVLAGNEQLHLRGVERSVVRLVLVIVPVYALLGVALRATWEMRSASAVVGIALIAATLAGILSTDFRTFKAEGIGIHITAERERDRKGRRRKQNTKSPTRSSVSEDTGSETMTVTMGSPPTSKKQRRNANGLTRDAVRYGRPPLGPDYEATGEPLPAQRRNGGR